MIDTYNNITTEEGRLFALFSKRHLPNVFELPVESSILLNQETTHVTMVENPLNLYTNIHVAIGILYEDCSVCLIARHAPF